MAPEISFYKENTPIHK